MENIKLSNEGAINLAEGILAQAREDYLLCMCLKDRYVDVFDEYGRDLIEELKNAKEHGNIVRQHKIENALKQWRRLKRKQPAIYAKLVRDEMRDFFYTPLFQMYSLGLDPDVAVKAMHDQLSDWYNSDTNKVRISKGRFRPLDEVLKEVC